MAKRCCALKAIEYGKNNRDVIILLHGGGLSWWSCREAAEILQQQYRVILPVLDGHAGSDRDFASIEDCAEALIAYIDEHFHGSVLLLGGLSLGAQIVTEMLAQRADVCRFAAVESAMLLPMKLTHWLVEPMMAMSYGLIAQDWFSALQFRALGIKPALYEDYRRDTRLITRVNMTAFLKANSAYACKPDVCKTSAKVLILAGQREPRKMLRSARLLNRVLRGSVLEIKAGMRHGEFSINHAAEYAARLISLIQA